MLYLLYLRNGFIKKFPLNKKSITLGRSKSNDFYLDENFVSKKHAKIDVLDNAIEIEDLGSTNGTFIDYKKITRERLEIDHSFRIGHINFFLKTGNARELVLSDKIHPVLQKLSRAISTPSEKTQAALSLVYKEPLAEMLNIGFSMSDTENILGYAGKLLDKVLREGCLVLAKQERQAFKVISAWNPITPYSRDIDEIEHSGEMFRRQVLNHPVNSGRYVTSFPVNWNGEHAALVYITGDSEPVEHSINEFLEVLGVEIEIIRSLMQQNKSNEPRNRAQHIPEIITANKEMISLLGRCKKIAQSDLFALIEGETGTGKELIAQFIHKESPRSDGEFVGLNCAAIPENLIEIELFGHEKGAFTDASTSRKGKLEVASSGTLVLDEIGDMPLNLQSKLLRAIQEGKFYHLGGNTPIKVDLRVICLTNKSIKGLIEKKLFREDLYYRISHVTLKIPPLRERKEDIIPLINHFVTMFSHKNSISIQGFSNQATHAMEIYPWPGNIRELENEIKKIMNLAEDGDMIGLHDLKEEITSHYGRHYRVNRDDSRSEEKLILELLEKHKWNKSMVAREMGISRPALYEKLKKYHIQ